MIALPPDVTLAPDLDVEPARQCIHYGAADAVEAAGDRVSAAAELSAGVQDGQHDLDGRLLLHRVDVDRDAATVVDHAHSAVRQDRHLDVVGVAGKSLIDRVVDDFVD